MEVKVIRICGNVILKFKITENYIENGYRILVSKYLNDIAQTKIKENDVWAKGFKTEKEAENYLLDKIDNYFKKGICKTIK